MDHFLNQEHPDEFFVFFPVGRKLAGGKIMHLDA